MHEVCTLVLFIHNWGERSEPPPSVADEGLVYLSESTVVLSM